MRKRISLVCRVVCLAVILGFNATALAGDINPPSGPIGPTMKTLVEVEPRVAVHSLPGSDIALHVISEPGSYYLTGNITGVSGKNGILFSTSNFTLDLNGFSLLGVSGSLVGIAPVGTPPGTFESITIRSGVVRGWGGGGIVMTNDENTGSGHALVSQIHADANGGYGIKVGQGSQVLKCRAAGNSLAGIFIDAGSLAEYCTSTRNGVNGIVSAERCSILNCTAHENTGDGIATGGGGCTVAHCTAGANTAIGIRVGKYTSVTDCTTNGNGRIGIKAGNGSMITHCTSGENPIGIDLSNSGAVTSCTVYANATHGITVNSGSRIVGNNCDTNGNTGDGAGIHITSDENLVQDNNLANNKRGIWSVDGGNLIVKNNAIGNHTTNYELHAADIVGAITANPTTANAWANFSN